MANIQDVALRAKVSVTTGRMSKDTLARITATIAALNHRPTPA